MNTMGQCIASQNLASSSTPTQRARTCFIALMTIYPFAACSWKELNVHSGSRGRLCSHTAGGEVQSESVGHRSHSPACRSFSEWLPLLVCIFFFFPLQALANNSKKAPTKPEQLPESCTENHHHSARCPRTHADTVLAPSSNAAKYMLHVKPKWRLRSH